MKTLLVFLTIFISGATNAQTDSIRSAKDYIKQKEKTDPNMNGVKRPKFKKSDTVYAILQPGNSSHPKQNRQKL